MVATKLKTAAARLDRKITALRRQKEKYIIDMDSKISKLQGEAFKISLRLSSLEKARQKRCKHDGEKRYRWNARDDASFDKYIYCKKCNDWIGKVGFDGQEYYD